MHPERIREIQAFLERWLQSPRAGDHPLYTGYLRSLAAGERLPAMEQYLRPLIGALAPLRHDERHAFANAACECIDFRNHSAGASPVPGIPHELLEQVVVPAVKEQRQLRPEDARAHAWLALLPVREVGVSLPTSRELLQEAHRLAPDDLFITERLAENWLDGVEFACHHLPEALLYPAEEVLRDLQEVRRLAALLEAGERDRLGGRADGYAREVEAFMARQSRAGSSPRP